MVEKKIGVFRGDGIGREIVPEALKTLSAVGEVYGHKFTFYEAPFGAGAWKTHGTVFPQEAKNLCYEVDAIIKGPIGDPSIESLIENPDERPERGGLLPLRRMLDAYANFRPVRLEPQLKDASPLKDVIIGDGIDILMIRELTGGIYFGRKVEDKVNEGERTDVPLGARYALDECLYDEHQIARIARVALREASNRSVPLYNIHKANVLATGRLWIKIVSEVAKAEFPNVKVLDYLVDNAAFQLVTNPRQFKVMLLENMQGDILTDEAGGILGSLGLMPSSCINMEAHLNPETGKGSYGFYEPAHGSAPTIAGQGKANPYSQIGAAAMMLEMSFGLKKEAGAVWDALASVFGAGYRTAELTTPETPIEKIINTSKFGDLVVEHIQARGG